MDYKSVIEEQIRELQKVHDKLSDNCNPYDAAEIHCLIAKTIADLTETAKRH